MLRRWSPRTVLFGAAAMAMACPAPESVKDHPGAPAASEPVIPTVEVSASARNAAPAWVADLPHAAPPGSVGDRVWATVPQPGSELATIGVYRLESVGQNSASLTDRMGQRVTGVPGALVHAASEGGKLEEGQIVLCYAWTLAAVIGRVTELSAGHEIEVQYDWAGTTKKAAIEHAQPPIEGIAPLAFVGFPKGGSTSRGMIVALTEDKAWLRTASGHVEAHARRALTALPLPTTDLVAGARVRAFRWATGFVEGKVKDVLETGLRYRVSFGGDNPDADYFFSHVAALR